MALACAVMSASMSILVGTLALTWTAHTGLVTKVTVGDVSVSGASSTRVTLVTLT